MSKFLTSYNNARYLWDNILSSIVYGITFEDFLEISDVYAFPQISIETGERVIHQMMILGFPPIRMFAVYRDNILQYTVFNPKKEFFRDLDERFMCTRMEAFSRY